jgi:hypothetical protein
LPVTLAWPDARDGLQQIWSARIDATGSLTVSPDPASEGPIKARILASREAETPAGQAELPAVVGYLGNDVSEKVETVAPGGSALVEQLFQPPPAVGRRTLALLQVAAAENGGELRKDTAVEAFGAWYAVVDYPDSASALVKLTGDLAASVRPLPELKAKAIALCAAEDALWVLARAQGEHRVYHSGDGLNWDLAFFARGSAEWTRLAVRQGAVFLISESPKIAVNYVAARQFTVRAVASPVVRVVVPDGYGQRAGNYGTLAEIGMPRGGKAFRHQTVLLPDAWPKTDAPLLLTGMAYRPKSHPRSKEPYENTVGEISYTLGRTMAPAAGFVATQFAANLGSGAALVYQGPLSWRTDLQGGFDAQVRFKRPFLLDPSREALVMDVRVPVGAERQVYFDAVRDPALPALRMLAGLDLMTSESTDNSTPVLEFTAMPQPHAPQRPRLEVAVSGASQRGAKLALADGAAWAWCRWTRVSGPGDAVFAALSASETQVAFTAAGSHRLRCEAGDGRHTVARDFVVNIQP